MKTGCALDVGKPPKENQAPYPVQTRTKGKDYGVPLASLSPELSQESCSPTTFPLGLTLAQCSLK